MRFRTLGLTALVALSSLLSACAGSGSGATPPVTQSLAADPGTQSTISTQSVTKLANGQLQVTGTIGSVSATRLTVQTGNPSGNVHVYINSATQITGPKLAIGQQIIATGTGSTTLGVTAVTIVQANATPGPSPLPSTSASPVPPATASLMRSSAGKIGLFQVFDAFGSSHYISSSQAQADGYRYGVVWGARPGMPPYWTAGSSALTGTYYMPQETDASPTYWGGAGHTLAWWQSTHPDWILYACTADGTPTTTPAYISELPNNVTLDIHNPAVVDYQVKLAAKYAIAHGYQGIAYDEVLFFNITGNGVAATDYGCGIRQNGAFVRRYTGRSDPNWTADTIAWVKAAKQILTTDTTLAPYHLKLIVNHPAGNVSNVNEQQLLQNVDADLNETGFSDYGSYQNKPSLFKTTVDWMVYAQSHGVAPLIIDKFDQTTAITPSQLEYSIATYLMGHNGASGLFVGNANGYGVENYHSEYNAAIGTPCSSYYGGASVDPNNPQIWYRKFSGALVVVNSGSLPKTSEIAHLPTNHTYKDLEGQAVSNPLTVPSTGGFVLLTTNGCQ